MILPLDRKVLTVINVGVVFFLTFTGFRTLENTEKILVQFAHEDDPNFTADGFMPLAIAFFVFSVSMWFVPSVIDALGLKRTLILSTITYTIFLTSFLTFSTWYVYATSVVVGVGMALTWGSGGTIVNQCSDETTIIRNFGIFYFLYSASLLGGNGFQYFQSRGLTRFDYSTRLTLVLVLIGLSCAGTLAAFLLSVPEVATEAPLADRGSPLKAFFKTLNLMKRRETRLMCVTFFFAGLFVAFASGVYSPSVGSTLTLSSSKSLIGLSGVFLGIGGITGCALLGTLGIALAKWDHKRRVMACSLILAVPLILTLLNLADQSPQGDTGEDSIIPSSPILAIAVSWALGLGMSLINNQCYVVIDLMFKDDHAGGNAIYNFFLGIGSSSSFFYSNYLGLYSQLSIMLCMLIASTLCAIVAVKHYKATISVPMEIYTIH